SCRPGSRQGDQDGGNLLRERGPQGRPQGVHGKAHAEVCGQVDMRILTGVALFFFLLGNSLAQNYPTKPPKLVVGYPPGGSGDFTTRIIADELSKELGVTVVVENKPGAGGSIASEFVAKSAPDGYTILNQGHHAYNRVMYKNLSYGDKDFIP